MIATKQQKGEMGGAEARRGSQGRITNELLSQLGLIPTFYHPTVPLHYQFIKGLNQGVGYNHFPKAYQLSIKLSIHKPVGYTSYSNHDYGTNDQN